MTTLQEIAIIASAFSISVTLFMSIAVTQLGKIAYELKRRNDRDK